MSLIIQRDQQKKRFKIIENLKNINFLHNFVNKTAVKLKIK